MYDLFTWTDWDSVGEKNRTLPMNHIVRVKVHQSLQCTMDYSCYFHLLQGLFVDCLKEKDVRYSNGCNGI